MRQSHAPTDDFLLFYLRPFGKTVVFSDGVAEYMLPRSLIKFVQPPANKLTEPIMVTVPQWLARQEGLYEVKPGSLKTLVTLYVKVLVRGDNSWQITDGRIDPVWIEKRLIKCKSIDMVKKEAVIQVPEYWARKKGIID